ncbi:MAG: ABC transporter permease [Coriobacteriales bacterium]|nr:ABC transporter permease [Coriobacteriales bacterium]
MPSSLVFGVQFAVALLVVCYAFSDLFPILGDLDTASAHNTVHDYVFEDSSSTQYSGLASEPDHATNQKFIKLYEDIRALNCRTEQIVYGYDGIHEKNGSGHGTFYVNVGFFMRNGLRIASGRKFSANDFRGATKTTPIIIGHNLRDRYRLGKTYVLRHLGDGSKFTAAVVGVLPARSGFDKTGQPGTLTSLDQSCIVPLSDSLVKTHLVDDIYDIILNTTVSTPNLQQLANITTLSMQLSLPTFTYRDVATVDQEYAQDLFLDAFGRFCFAGLILIFACLTIAVNMVRVIKKEERDFAIHLVCGATVACLCLRIIINLLLCFFIVILICSLLFGFGLALVATTIVGVVIVVLTMIYPIWNLTRLNVFRAIGGGE